MSNPFRQVYLEALKGGQHKIDVDKNGKIEGEDLAKLRAKKMNKEEAEQIDELDKKTLASYAYKAAGDATDKARESERRASSAKEAEKRAKDPKLAFAKSANQSVQKHEMGKSAEASKKSAKRLSGVLKAASKLAYKEEVEQIDELTDDQIKKLRADAADHAKKSIDKQSDDRIAKLKSDKEDSKKSFLQRVGDKQIAMVKGAVKGLMKKEEIELTEANHREFASKGMMHPDMAKHMSVGQEHDYYEHGTGDKVSGKVVKKTATEVHMKQTHDSYDPKKKGTVHKFKIGSTLPEETSMEYTQEELALIEQFIDIAEKMNMSKASMGDVIKDFKKSDAPQFKGKSDEKRRQMAIAAKLSADREAKKEEVELVSFKGFNLDEIKMSDLPSRKVSGKYGTEYYKKEKEKDEKGYDADDDKEDSSEKRGRGRPKGSSSGARQKGSTPKKKGSGVEMTGYPLHLPGK